MKYSKFKLLKFIQAYSQVVALKIYFFILLIPVDYMDELWGKLFRVMDDHHEATRLAANRTTRVLSKVSSLIYLLCLWFH